MAETVQVSPPTPVDSSIPTSNPASRVPSTVLLYVPSVEGNLSATGNPSGSSPYMTNTASARTSYTRVGEDVAQQEVEEDEGEDEQQPSSSSPAEDQPAPPQATLTFLLISSRRKTMSFAPETAIGRVKELVWNAWPTEWEEPDKKPPSPAYIRLLYLGKILQDEDTLEHLRFSLTTPTVVHVSIRPIAPPPADDYTKKRWLGREHGEGEAAAVNGCCGCMIC